MTVEMRMKDGRKFVGDYAKVHGTMVAVHGKNPDKDPIGSLYSNGPLVALVPISNVLEIVRIQEPERKEAEPGSLHLCTCRDFANFAGDHETCDVHKGLRHEDCPACSGGRGGSG